MKNLLKYKIALVLLCISIELCSQTISLSGKVEEGNGRKMFLSKLTGGQQIIIDSIVLSASGEFKFSIENKYKGLCRLWFDESHFADLIINNENTVVKFNAEKPEKTINVQESIENKAYYSFLAATQSINDSIFELTQKGEKLYEKDKVFYKKDLEELVAKINNLNTSKNILAISFVSENKNLFASKIIGATVIPDYKDYLETEKNPAFKSEKEFLKYHYLDNLDFSDSAMLNTPLIYERCGEYIRYFSSPPSVKTYKEIIDILMGKVSVNIAIREYVTEILLKSFDSPSWEDVYTYIADNYYLNSTCAIKADSVAIADKSELIKKLKPGNIAPNFSILTETGASYNLSESKEKYTLIFFWASWCEFCEDAMPEIKKIYSEYSTKGLEIVSISADTLKDSWISSSKKNEILWTNACDFKGFSSQILKDYNVMRTPNIFLVDENKIIIGHFYNAAAVRKSIETIDWK